MNAFEFYKTHNQAINTYLLVYAAVIGIFVLSAFLLYRYSGPQPFYKGLFFTLLLAGAVLAGSGLNFRKNNIRERAAMEMRYKQDPGKFLDEQFSAASRYEPHFYRLLAIWCVAIAVMALCVFLFFQRKAVVGICTGLAICCLLSLALDFAGFRSDASYYAALERLVHDRDEYGLNR